MDYRVLAVDGSATVQRVLKIAFATEDWPTEVVGSAAEALAAARRQRPSLVVVAAALPDGDGYALCQALRREADLCTVPVVVVTCGRGPWRPERVAELGPVGHLAKPFTSQALLAQARHLLAQTADTRPATADSGAPHAAAAPTVWPAAPSFASAPSRVPGPSGAPPTAPAALLPGAVPQQTMPQQVAPQRTAPQQAMPQQTTSPQTVPQQTTPQQLTPAHTPPEQGTMPPTPPGSTALQARAAAPAECAPPRTALPPLPDWDAPVALGRTLAAPQAVADAVAKTLARLAPNLDAEALNAHVQATVEREVVAILWEVVPKLAEAHLLAANQAEARVGRRGGGPALSAAETARRTPPKTPLRPS